MRPTFSLDICAVLSVLAVGCGGAAFGTSGDPNAVSADSALVVECDLPELGSAGTERVVRVTCGEPQTDAGPVANDFWWVGYGPATDSNEFAYNCAPLTAVPPTGCVSGAPCQAHAIGGAEWMPLGPLRVRQGTCR